MPSCWVIARPARPKTALERFFSKEIPVPRAILEIRRVEGAEPRQLEISRVLAEDWVMGDAPFDEQFK